MRLQNCVPPLKHEVVQALQDIDVKTDTDLLLADDPINIFTKLPPGHGISLKDFNQIVAQVAEIAAAVPVYGDKLLDRESNRKEEIFLDDMLVGLPDLDALLGGFGPPRIIEISGDAGSGKTALALHVSLRYLAHVEYSGALWIDSGGEFSPERVALVLEQLGGPYSSTALERLQVSLAFDIEAVHQVLEELRQSLTIAQGDGGQASRCIVIDSITTLLGPMLSAASSQGHATMTTFMRQVRALAELFSLTVIVINSSTSLGQKNLKPRNPDAVFELMRKPALGPSFTFLTDATLWLSKRHPDPRDRVDAGSTLHTAEVFRSRTTRSKTWARFRIKDGLIVGA
ncbi:P-loop containing nucleoside triphosphate hydrolase protein [Ganoderma leucocontextum]|nr:P-loop containing nucleoside triphosphate hydrolase protein [Ganoderma leucocontextum]